jgi:hypothetical protein
MIHSSGECQKGTQPLFSRTRHGEARIRSRRDFLRRAWMLGAATMATSLALESPSLAQSTTRALRIAEGGKGLKSSSAKKPAPVHIPDVSIFVKSPDACLVGVTNKDIMEIKLADVPKFHGYCAGGVAFAFRAVQEAFKVLYGNKVPLRQSLKVQTSHHCCQAGAGVYYRCQGEFRGGAEYWRSGPDPQRDEKAGVYGQEVKTAGHIKTPF